MEREVGYYRRLSLWFKQRKQMPYAGFLMHVRCQTNPASRKAASNHKVSSVAGERGAVLTVIRSLRMDSELNLSMTSLAEEKSPPFLT